MRRFRCLLILSSVLVRKSAADAQCYGVNGQKNSGLSPCNSAATGTGGSHAACCDESQQEACLSSGLCLATQRNDNVTFWAEGCTDPAGLDAACPSYCGASSQFISMPLQTSYAMMFCGDSSWCCCFDNFGKSCDTTQCCTRNFTLTRGIGTVVRQFDNTGSSNNIDDDNPRGGPNGNDSFDWRGRGLIPVVVAAVVGSLLLAIIVAFGFTWSQNRRLKRQVENLQEISTKTLSFSTIPARPSVSVQPSTAASYPLSYPPEPYPEELLSPNESYHNIVRTLSANRPQNYSTYQPQPPTPSSATQGPGFGYFQGQPAAPAPRRPSWSSRNVRHADSTASFSEFMGRQGISELPAEKEPRHF